MDGDARVETAGRDDVANRLHSLAIHLLRRVRQQDTLSGMGPARLAALSVVGFGGPHTLTQLAAAEQVSPPTMSRIVAAMEREGLVCREPDRRDGRILWVVATDEGRKVLHAGRARRTEQLRALLAELTPDEHEAVRRALDALERVFGEPH